MGEEGWSARLVISAWDGLTGGGDRYGGQEEEEKQPAVMNWKVEGI